MARTGATTTAAALVLLLVLVIANATAIDAAAGGYQMTAAVAGGRRGGRAQPTGLTQCVGVCGTTITSCLLDCYDTSAEGGRKKILPICLLDCTNDAMFCATDCSTQAL